MSNVTVPLSDKLSTREQQAEESGRSRPVWWLVFVRELSELWIWGKAAVLIILYSIYLGISSYFFAADSELSLIPPREMVYLTIVGAIIAGLFMALIIGADSFSGERERSTLEALLLTPADRTQIVIGKFLASISPWPVAMLISVPYVIVLSQGDSIVLTALLWGAILGSLLSLAFTGMAMIISLWSGSNRTSLFAGLTIYLLFLLPVQFPSSAQSGPFGTLLRKLNPLDGADHFLEEIIVNFAKVHQVIPFLWSSIVFSLLIFVILFFVVAPSLRLAAGIPFRFRRKKNTPVMSLLLAGCLLLSSRIAPAHALAAENLQISIDTTSAVAKTGDKVEFHTTVTNTGEEDSAPLVVAMNIINLDAEGETVDPEDWSPERTQYLEALAPGQSATQTWLLNTILEGDYLVYIVLIPTPESQSSSSHPITSPGMHVEVSPFTRLNPGGILPLSVGIPLLLILVAFAVLQLRRRSIDVGSFA